MILMKSTLLEKNIHMHNFFLRLAKNTFDICDKRSVLVILLQLILINILFDELPVLRKIVFICIYILIYL